MSYADKFAITDIVTTKNRELLSLSTDDLGDSLAPVILYVPDKEKFEHFHIQLSRKSAKKLRNWLNDNLKDTK